MRPIYTDSPPNYLPGIIVSVGGLSDSQKYIGDLLCQPHGDTELVLDQDVLTVLEVARMDYQRLQVHMSIADTLDDGKNTRTSSAENL
jgi:hypothetical protein